ncbi:hypothetical protein WJX73_005625 [Symbiochloris irregularis]|uniref:CID domain-containing protein n=1 Tax=Symbiochloris irregularis TaxID=706552 RepID=A0AAW1NNR5_9CHLO
MDPSKFFNPWEAPPHFEPAPPDGALIQRIQKLAQFALRNGPSFIDLMTKKQQGNPEYAFLSGGHGSAYFRWTLYCLLHNLNPDQPGSQGAAGNKGQGPSQLAPAAEAGSAQQLPEAVEQGFSAVLSALTGSRESIKTSKEWFMASVAHVEGLAVKMATHLQSLPSYDKQLHVIYLANDVLLKSATQRQGGSTEQDDRVARAFLPVLPAMLHCAYVTGGQQPEVGERLGTIVQFWADRAVYKKGTVDMLRQAMEAGPAAAAEAHAVQASTSHPPAQHQSQPHLQHDPHHTSQQQQLPHTWQQPPHEASPHPQTPPADALGQQHSQLSTMRCLLHITLHPFLPQGHCQ